MLTQISFLASLTCFALTPTATPPPNPLPPALPHRQSELALTNARSASARAADSAQARASSVMQGLERVQLIIERRRQRAAEERAKAEAEAAEAAATAAAARELEAGVKPEAAAAGHIHEAAATSGTEPAAPTLPSSATADTTAIQQPVQSAMLGVADDPVKPEPGLGAAGAGLSTAAPSLAPAWPQIPVLTPAPELVPQQPPAQAAEDDDEWEAA